MIDLSGSLKTVDLLPLVRLLSGLRQTGTLVLSGQDWSARLGLQDGRVVSASFGDETGLRALMALNLVMGEGEFVYLQGVEPGERELDLTPDGLSAHLLRKDAAALAMDLDAVFSPVRERVDAIGDELVLKRRTVMRLMAIDGRRTVREIIGEPPTLANLLDLAQLLDLGLIRLESDAAAARQLPGKISSLQDRSRAAQVPPTIARRSSAPTPPDLGRPSRMPLVGCPKLGFADDPESHLERPSPLHRCYALDDAGLRLTTAEQRELCLSDQYPTCPRLDAALGSGAPPLILSSGLRDLPRLGSPVGANGTGVNGTHSPNNGVTLVPPAADNGRGRADAFDTNSRYQPFKAGTVGAAPADRSDAPDPRATRRDRLIKAVSIALAIAAVVATLFVIVRPRVSAPPPGGSPAPPAAAVNAAPPAGSSASAPAVNAAAPPAAANPDDQPPLPGGPPAVGPAGGAAAAPPGAPANPGAPSVVGTSPSGAASSNGTGAPASAPAAAPAAAPPAGGAATGPVLLAADFATQQAGWPESPPAATWSAGAYRLSPTPGSFAAVAAPLPFPMGDATVSATFRKLGGPAGGGYGLIVRDQEPNQRNGSNQSGHFYVLEVGDKGEFGMWRRDVDHWVDLVAWTPSSVVHPGLAENRLVASTVGNQLTLTINGADVRTVSDSTFSSGGVGVFAGGDGNQVALTNFTVQASVH